MTRPRLAQSRMRLGCSLPLAQSPCMRERQLALPLALFVPNSLRCRGCLRAVVGNLANADQIVPALIERHGQRLNDGVQRCGIVHVLIRLPRRLTVASDRTVEAVVQSLGGSCKRDRLNATR